MNWSKLSKEELNEFLNMYPSVPQDPKLSLSEQAAALFEELSKDLSAEYPEPVSDLYLASKISSQLDKFPVYKSEDILKLPEIALLDLGRRLGMSPHKISVRRIIRILDYLGLLSSVSPTEILSSQPILEIICPQLSFPDAMNLRVVLKVPELNCIVPISDPDGVVSKLSPVNADTIKIYKLITEFGSVEALSKLVLKNDYKLVQIFINNGADPTATTASHPLNPVNDVFKTGSSKMLKILLSSPFSNKFTPDGFGGALSIAINNKQEALVRLLLTYPININFTSDLDGSTPLILSSFIGLVQITKLLLENGADPNIINARGSGALIFASQRGHFEIIDLLLKRGANPNIVSLDGTALGLAIQGNHESVVRLLLENGANPNFNGILFLHYAANNESIFRLLLEHGADKNMRDAEGKTIFDYILPPTANIRELLED